MNQKDKESEPEGVSVAPVDDYSFRKVIGANFYAFPATRNKKIRNYLAFYRVGPVSKITHMGKVLRIEEKADVGSKYRLLAFGDNFDDEARKVILEDVEELDKPIPYEKGASVQSVFHTTLSKFEKAETVLDLQKDC